MACLHGSDVRLENLNVNERTMLTNAWFIGSMPHSQGLSNNPYPEPDQPKSSCPIVFAMICHGRSKL